MFRLQIWLVAISFVRIQNPNSQITSAYQKVKLAPGLILVTLEKSLNVVPQCSLRKTPSITFYCRTAAATLTDLGAWVFIVVLLLVCSLSVCVAVLFVASLLFPVLVDISC